jgi:hypothetical protein
MTSLDLFARVSRCSVSLLKPMINIGDAMRPRSACGDHANLGDGRRARWPVMDSSCRNAMRVVRAAHQSHG